MSGSRELRPRCDSGAGKVAGVDVAVNLVDDWEDVGDGFSGEVGAGGAEFAVGGCEQGGLAGGVEDLPLSLGEADGVATAGEADGPHAGVAAFFDVGGGVADFDAVGEWIDAQVDGEMEAHIRVGAAGADGFGSEGAVGGVALGGSEGLKLIEHGAGVAGGAGDFDAAGAEGGGDVDGSRDHLGVADEALHHAGLELGVELVGQGFEGCRGGGPMGRPGGSDGGIFQKLADVVALGQAHVFADVGAGDGQAGGGEDVFDGFDGGDAAMVDDGAGPVEENGGNRAPRP